NAGHMEQIGTPETVYARPATTFVAGFIGSPPMNLLRGRIDASNFVVDGAVLPLAAPAPHSGDVLLGLRPEHAELRPGAAGWPLQVEMIEIAGADDRRDAAAAASRRPLALVRQRDAASHLTMAPWPFPLWIAHRGAGKLAPENTLAAFRLGASHGHTAFECDVKLSADGVLFLLHDDTLDRTTSGRGAAGPRPWAELSRLDAGSWHSAA